MTAPKGGPVQTTTGPVESPAPVSIDPNKKKKPPENIADGATQPAQPEIPQKFTPAYHEMVKTVDTPEAHARKLEEIDNSDVLIDTISSHFRIMKAMKDDKRPNNTTMRGRFYVVFREYLRKNNVNLDTLNDKDLRDYSAQFLSLGGAQIRMGLKLAEWEAATLQMASGWQLVEKQREGSPGGNHPRVYELVQTPNGLQRKEKRWQMPSSVLSVADKVGGIFNKKGKYDYTGGDEMKIIQAVQAGLLSAEQQAYLEACNWENRQLTDQEKIKLDTRLNAITDLRHELYIKTDVPSHKITANDLNFIGNTDRNPLGRGYFDTKRVHFLGEGMTGRNVMEIIQNEGLAIAKEVREKVNEKLGKEPTRDELTLQRLQAEHQSLESKKPTAGQIAAEQRRIDAEIGQLQVALAKYDLQPKRATELLAAQKRLQEAIDALNRRATEIASITGGVSPKDLVKWADPQDAAGWVKLEEEAKTLERQFTNKKDVLAKKQHRLEANFQNPPPTQETIEKDAQGNVVKVIPVSEQMIKFFDTWVEQRGNLLKEIKQLEDDITSGTLETQWVTVKNKMQRRKDVVEDPVTKKAINEYLDAFAAESSASNAKTSVDDEVKILQRQNKTVESISDEIAKKMKQKENAGGPKLEDQAEVKALNALEKAYDQATAEECDSLINNADFGESPLEYNHVVWAGYPECVVRCMQLIWGNDILFPTEKNKDLVDQVQTLMRSPRYLDIFVTQLEAFHLSTLRIPLMPANSYVDLNAAKASKDADGTYKVDAIKTMFTGKAISTVRFDLINRSVIERIREEMRKKALHITA